MIKKTKNNHGETIAETLIALLLTALALVMLAGAIATSSGIIKKSSKTLDEYFTDSNHLLEINDEYNDGSKIISIKEAGKNVQDNISVYFKENDTFGKPIVAFDLRK